MLHSMRKNSVFAAALAAAALAGCSNRSDEQLAPEGELGSAKVTLTAADLGAVDHLKLSINGGATPITQNMTKVDETHYSAEVLGIPAGNYTFTANGYADAAEAHLALTGRADKVAIHAVQTSQVTIVLRDPTAPEDVTKRLPIIDALSSSAITVASGATASVSVTAHSPEDHGLTYIWHDSCGGAHGVFDDPMVAATSWTAPTGAGLCQLSVGVSDPTNATEVTAYLAITVSVNGSANVSGVVDTYPMVAVGSAHAVIVTANPPAGLEVGISAHVVATGSDADGSPVTFRWSSNCGGTFGPSNSAATVDFHTADPSAACTLTAVVADNSTPANSVTAVVVLTGSNRCSGVICPQASDACHVTGTCNPATGLCSSPAKPDGDACDDGNACTPTDTCQGGVCVGGGNYALQFDVRNVRDQTSPHNQVPNSSSLALTTGLTIDAQVYWIGGTAGLGYRPYVSKPYGDKGAEASTGYTMGLDDGKPCLALGFGNSNRVLCDTSAIPANTWVRLTGTYDGTVLTLYANGLQVAQQGNPTVASLNTDSTSLVVGREFIDLPSLADRTFPGSLDELRIWNTALPATAVKGLPACGLTPDANLVAYWNFNEGKGTTAGDSSGNGNTGTLTNSPTWIAH